MRAGFEVGGLTTELDLSSRRACRRALARAHADVVIDCSAADDFGEEPHTGELEELLAGSENLALAASAAGAHSVFLSSMRVFGEGQGGPRVESDQPEPTSALGAAVLRAERITARLNDQHTILRSSALYGREWAGLFEDLIARAGVAERLLVEQRPTSPPTYAPHLAAVLVALVRRPCYGIVHRAASGDCNELELAREVTRLASLRSHIESAPPGPPGESWPACSVCLTSRRDELPPITDWRIGLRVWAMERQNGKQRVKP